MKKIILTQITLLLTLSSLSIVYCKAQDKDSSSVSETVQSFLGLNQPKIGVLAQLEGGLINDGTETDLIGNWRKRTRLYLFTLPTQKFSFYFQGDINNNFSLLDLKLSYNFREYLNIDAGQFKVPFGKEYLIKDANLLFINRALAVENITPGRQQGVQVRGKLLEHRLTYALNLSAGGGNSADDNISLYSGKLSFIPYQSEIMEEKLNVELQGSFAYTNDKNDFYYDDYNSDENLFWEVDCKINYNDNWFEIEYLKVNGLTSLPTSGFHVDFRKKTSDEVEIAARFDWWNYYSYNYIGGGKFIETYPVNRSYHVGLNWYPENEIKMQLNFQHNQTFQYSTVMLFFQYALNAGN
ncbi:MAG: hypothetical protein HYZ34_09070 [Ignavibacteriae bacterium]|nr:hypothetical protein [Ignavibacteriota bacterium]